MRDNIRITSYQTILLIIAFRIVPAFSYFPAINTPPGNQDNWIMIILSMFYTIILCFPILFLSNKFKDFTLVEYMDLIFGKVFGKIIGLFYSLIFLLFAIIFISTMVEILDSTMFPETPAWVTSSLMIITCIYVSYKGLEAIGRGAEIFVPLTLIIIIVLSILGANILDFSVFLPILSDSTFKDINSGSIDIGMKFLDILILAMIVPYLDKREDLNKIFIKSLIYSILIIVLMVVVVQAALGIEQAKHANFPFFTFARLINVFDIVHRIESIYVIIWIISNIGKITGYLFFSTVALSQTFKKRDNKAYIIPMAIIMFVISIIIKEKRSILAVKEPLDKISLFASLISIFIIPMIALIVYFFRRNTLKDKTSAK